MSRVGFVQGLVTGVIGRVPISVSGPTLLFLQIPHVAGTEDIVRRAVETLGRANHHLRSFVGTGENKTFLDDPTHRAFGLTCFRETEAQRGTEPGTGEVSDEIAGRARRAMVDLIIELFQERDDELERRGGTVIYFAILRRGAQKALRDHVRDDVLRAEGYQAYTSREQSIGGALVVEVGKLVHFAGDGLD
ncbi:MAG: hypothetical protein KDD66_02760 [Bdellovibrionales bacterium]|nr:hypothetical protein [Bdellovibrionales bacterium]